MGDFGIKISAVGKDVNTSTLEETSFDSRYSLSTKKYFAFISHLSRHVDSRNSSGIICNKSSMDFR